MRKTTLPSPAPPMARRRRRALRRYYRRPETAFGARHRRTLGRRNADLPRTRARQTHSCDRRALRRRWASAACSVPIPERPDDHGLGNTLRAKYLGRAAQAPALADRRPHARDDADADDRGGLFRQDRRPAGPPRHAALSGRGAGSGPALKIARPCRRCRLRPALPRHGASAIRGQYRRRRGCGTRRRSRPVQRRRPPDAQFRRGARQHGGRRDRTRSGARRELVDRAVARLARK